MNMRKGGRVKKQVESLSVRQMSLIEKVENELKRKRDVLKKSK